MRLCGILLLVLVCVNSCAAQEVLKQPESPPGLVVLKVKYARHRDDHNVQSTSTDPGAFENTGIMPTGKTPTIYLYEYSVQLRNDLPRNIKWLYWAHLISDANSKLQLDRQEFVSFEKISANQKETIVGTKKFSHVADYETRKKTDPRPEERVEFICIGYDDGTLWHAPSVSQSRCLEVEKRRKPQ